MNNSADDYSDCAPIACLQLPLDLSEPYPSRTLDELGRIEALFRLGKYDSASLAGLALVSWSQGAVRLTSKGREFYRPACELAGIAPTDVKTLAQLRTVRSMDAELMLQRLMDTELNELEAQLCT